MISRGRLSVEADRMDATRNRAQRVKTSTRVLAADGGGEMAEESVKGIRAGRVSEWLASHIDGVLLPLRFEMIVLHSLNQRAERQPIC